MLEQIKMLRLQQPATALDKYLYVNVGWRPRMAWVMNYKAAGNMAVAVDGFQTATTEGGVSFGANAAQAEIGTDGITFTDKGIKLGKDATLIKEDAAELFVILFRNLSEIDEIDLSDSKENVAAYGSGKQFGDETEAGAISARRLTEVGVTVSDS